MFKAIRFLFSMIFLLILFSSQTFAAETIDINQLIDNAKIQDGRQFIIKGEVIGESMTRGEYCWVNLKDSTNAIGVWMKLSDMQKITHYGSYKYKGDSIIITGVFHRACIEHGGEADIHCEALMIEQKGFPVTVKVSTDRVFFAGSLLLVLFIAIIVVYYFVIRKKNLNL